MLDRMVAGVDDRLEGEIDPAVQQRALDQVGDREVDPLRTPPLLRFPIGLHRIAAGALGFQHRALGLGQSVASGARLPGDRDPAGGNGDAEVAAGRLDRARAEIAQNRLDHLLRLLGAGLAQDHGETIAGDAFTVDLRGPYDVILITNLLHHFDFEANVRLLRRLRAALKPGGRAITLDKVEAMRSALNTCISSVRRMASEMRPIVLDDLGFAAAVQSLCQDLSERSAMPIELDLDPRLDIDDRDMGIALYRIVQEALTNVLRHAHAHHVWVTLRRDADEAELSVQDDGVGLASDQPRNGIGLVSMRERVLALGGEFNIYNRESGGTHVKIRWPLKSTVPQERTT